MYEDVASIGHNMGGRGTFLGVKIGLNFFSGSQFEFGSMFENLKNVHFLLPISSYPAIIKGASRYLLPRLHCVCVQAGDWGLKPDSNSNVNEVKQGYPNSSV